MDVVGGVNQWWFPWPRKAHVAGGFVCVVMGCDGLEHRSTGIRGFGDSGIMIQSWCSRWGVGSVLELEDSYCRTVVAPKRWRDRTTCKS
jgi:hypothetical protein